LRILKKLLIGLVILWGLLALLVRATTPFIADYREQLAAVVAQQLGVPVSIGSLKARWYGLRPLLEFDRVRFGEPDGEALEVKRVTFDLAPEQLLMGAWLDATRVTIDGMQLTMIREPTGQLHLEGIGTLAAAYGTERGPLALPRHIRLLNTRVAWIDRKAGKPPLMIQNIAVVLNHDGGRLQVRASLETERGSAELSARLDGLPTTTDWGGDTYLRVTDLDVADLFAQYLPASYGLRSLRLDLESWGRWENAAPVDTQGHFQLRDLDLRPSVGGAAPLQVWQAGARYSLRREAQDLRIGLKDLQLTFHGHRWPTGDLAVALLQQPDGSRRVEAAADYLRIDDVVRILQVRLPWEGLKEPLEHIRPRGELHKLRLSADLAAERPDWRVRADLVGVTTSPWGGVPGVDNLSGQLHGQQDHLMLRLDSRDAAMDFRALFREPIELTELEGRLDLVGDAENWQLTAQALRAVSPHIATVTRLRLEHRPGGPPFLDLQTDFSDGDAAFATRYYPVGIMGETLVKWLDHSIVSGRVPHGSTLLHGPLVGFPYETGRDGVFQVVFDTEDVVLDYRTDWPRVEGLDAHVKFHGNQLDIDAHAGRIHDSRVVEASARIPSLKPASAIDISGRLDGPLRDMLQVLGEGALRPRFGKFAEVMRGDGDVDLQLAFSLPLTEHGEQTLKGRLQLDRNRLSLPDWDLALDEVRGALDFTLDGLTAKGIQARILDTPISVDVRGPDNGTTRVVAKGRFAPEAIARRFSALPTTLLAGKADFIIRLDIPRRHDAADSPARLAVASDLEGISVALPPPFGKKAGDIRAFSVQVPLGADSAPGSLDYAGLVTAEFSTDAHRVDVRIGGGKAKLQTTQGIRIGGHLEELDLPAWGEAVAALKSGGGATLPALSADLQIDRVRADSAAVEGLRLTTSRADGVWRGEVQATNLAGRFIIPERPDAMPIEIDLQRLKIEAPLGSPEVASTPAPDADSGPDPSMLPGLVLGIADLQVNNARLGRLRVEAQRADAGLNVTELSLHGGELELESAGHWSREAGVLRTRLGGRIGTDDLGALLVNLGYSRQIEGAGSTAEFLLEWPGNPMQFHRASVRGRVGLEVAAGRLVELDPGVTRVFGLLNLNALTRRLRLDFRDIYQKGYSFDSIEGEFLFARGRARTELLRMLGPTGRIDVSGTADLMAQTLDQRVTVIPNLDATLPIASTIAGGPVAGIAVLVAQKVMTKQVENVNRFEYSVIGPWGEPEVNQLSSGGTLSKILQPLGRGGGDAAAQSGTAPAEAPAAPAEAARPVAEPAAPAPSTEDPAAAPAADEDKGVLRRLLDLLPEGKPHEGYLPGESD